jgi:hydrogenase/urease accessory protein HupE
MFFSVELLFQWMPSALPVAAGVSKDPVIAPFVRLGVEHIWTGYDHLLFLLALLAVCASFRASVRVISCFTLGHSLTLALATLDWVNLPARYAEPMTALTIVYVGVENLWLRGAEPGRRWLLTLCFGLIHGFGFDHGILIPLLGFNLGVEVGQVVVAAVVLPLLWRLRESDAFLRRGVPALSMFVAMAGLYWFLERTILS